MPWQYVGKEVWVRELAEEVDVLDGRARIAAHRLARLVHRLLKYGQQYIDKGAEYYELMTMFRLSSISLLL